MSYQPVIIKSGVSFIFMTVGLLVAFGWLKHFPKSRRRETKEKRLGTATLGLFLSVNVVVSSDQLPKGAVTCVFIDGLGFKIENLCPSTAFRFNFCGQVAATKNRNFHPPPIFSVVRSTRCPSRSSQRPNFGHSIG